MEFNFMSRLFADKQIMNPMNPDEVFTCKDLMNGKCNRTVDVFVYRLQDLSQGEENVNDKAITVSLLLRISCTR